jgi:hypothetical protein
LRVVIDFGFRTATPARATTTATATTTLLLLRRRLLRLLLLRCGLPFRSAAC